MQDNVKVLYKDKNVIVIEKPVGMPSQADPTGDTDAMTATSAELRASGENHALWLVHRLDRTVGGLLAFARNKRSAAELSRIVRDGELGKRYFAVCHGIAEDGEYRDLLFKDNATSKAYVVKTARSGAKLAILHARSLGVTDGMSLMAVELETGRFHQIRAQFASRGHSLVGDKKYGSRDTARRTPCLFSSSLSFELFGKRITVFAAPACDEYPWNLFDTELYGQLS